MARKRGDRRGVSLIEIMLALTILSVVLISLGGLMFQAARQTRRSAATTYRAAATQRAAAYIESLDWNDLPGAIGCQSDVSGQLDYDRCITVLDTTTQIRRVEITITSTGVLQTVPETLVVYRTRPRPASPIQ